MQKTSTSIGEVTPQIQNLPQLDLTDISTSVITLVIGLIAGATVVSKNYVRYIPLLRRVVPQLSRTQLDEYLEEVAKAIVEVEPLFNHQQNALKKYLEQPKAAAKTILSEQPRKEMASPLQKILSRQCK